MRISHLLVSAIAIATLGACGGGEEKGELKGEPVAAVAAPAGKQWIDVVSKTANGGYVVGNPDAKVKLVEYASLTCSHCRDFEEQGGPELMEKYVGTGKVSYEIRKFLLNPFDIPLSILTRCAGPEAYFGLTKQFYQNQASFLEAAGKVDPAKLEAAIKLPENQRYVALAQEMGAIEFFKSRGISEDQAKACLSDTARAKELTDITEKATKEKQVGGTPTFFLNGNKLDVNAWPAVKGKLQEAGAR
jgi:protein-disulfide isomerase